MKKITIILWLLSITMTIAAQELSGTWSGCLDIGLNKLTLVIHIENGEKGNRICTLDSPDQGVKGLPAVIRVLTSDSLNISIATIGASFEGKKIGHTLVGKFTQMGYSYDLSLTAGEIQVKRPQTPQPPFNYTEEEVTFENKEGQATLFGTLTYPINYNKMDKKSVPVVLMVSGSGLQNRDEEILDHKPFWIIADYLAKHGIASLRYDDRGIGMSRGEVATANTTDFMKDAACGLDYLRSLNKFGQIGILGHSEGGMIAFMLGAQIKTDFIVSLAGTGIRGDSLLTEQQGVALIQNGMPEEVSKDFRSVLLAVYAYKMNHEKIIDAKNVIDSIIKQNGVTFPTGANDSFARILTTQNAWLDYFMQYDPVKDIAKTNCPVFALNGSKDMQVISTSNLSNIKRFLPYNSKNLIKEYEGLNHLFQHCTSGNVSEYRKIEETISTEVLQDIADWINGLK